MSLQRSLPTAAQRKHVPPEGSPQLLSLVGWLNMALLAALMTGLYCGASQEVRLWALRVHCPQAGHSLSAPIRHAAEVCSWQLSQGSSVPALCGTLHTADR